MKFSESIRVCSTPVKRYDFQKQFEIAIFPSGKLRRPEKNLKTIKRF
jgi:hypothetical protein